ncbi:usg protein [Aestuariispira insulae]|uniref:Uncharacterized protein Usg n=1 Tax=Aestuariispira insulae TaxID=1461337 RepID=A0A3D9HH22_9PROT|nr:hypothetical protein [Aestuariispira insulae]RED48551.1 uncharacterized protein Usg [Aestuariispira insulae]
MDYKQSNPLDLQLKGYRLATAEIIYHLPDHPKLLQSFLWQFYDVIPDFPELHKFLDFWRDNLDGPLHSVRVSSQELITPGDSRFVDVQYTLH